MKKPILVIMAAGMGSRYGGLKQMDIIDEYGSLIMDYSIYDGVKAGFEKVIFIITREMAAPFKARIGDRISSIIETTYIYQDLHSYTTDGEVPPGRTKPWGTAHAVLCCKEAITAPFAVINADDYYGPQAFAVIYQELLKIAQQPGRHAMVGYPLNHTLTENGHVSRGVCRLKDGCWLEGIREYEKIEKNHEFPADTIVSMNMWGFGESILPAIAAGFRDFITGQVPKNPLGSEFYLPSVIASQLTRNQISVKVLTTKEQWYGVTYKEDKPAIIAAIRRLKDAGVYPEQLWRD